MTDGLVNWCKLTHEAETEYQIKTWEQKNEPSMLSLIHVGHCSRASLPHPAVSQCLVDSEPLTVAAIFLLRAVNARLHSLLARSAAARNEVRASLGVLSVLTAASKLRAMSSE